MRHVNVVAVDLGSESGRVIGIHFDGKRLATREIHRFPNIPVTLGGTLHWDILRLWHEIQHGLQRALISSPNAPVDGIAIDSFGVDFGLLDANDHLIANPVHRGDSRTEGVVDWVFERAPREVLFQRTGVGFHPGNTLFQLAWLAQAAPWQLEAARTLLTMPNLLNFWLTGEKLSEFTHSTTTQCYNPFSRDWDWETLLSLGIPSRIFPRLAIPGTPIGHYRGVRVFTTASHDTASAVAAVPTLTPNYAYLIGGLWGMIGLEASQPVVNAAALSANLSNEGGAQDTYRLLKPVMGQWMIQQCRVAWHTQKQESDLAQLLALAANAPPHNAFVDPDDPSFAKPGDMPQRVVEFCERTGQRAPVTQGQVVRIILESLALKYRHALNQLVQATGQPVEVLHVVGGAGQNPALCQMAANATHRMVMAAPVEASGLGNGLVQLIALGELRNLTEARAVVAASFPPACYVPERDAEWDAAYERFKGLITGT